MSDTGPHTRALRGFFPFVSGESISMQQAGSAAILARGDVSLENSGSQVLLTNGGASIANGGAQTVLANGDVEISQGGALLTAARQIEVDHGFVGLAVGRDVRLTDSKVLLTPPGALLIAAGLALGIGLAARGRSKS